MSAHDLGLPPSFEQAMKRRLGATRNLRRSGGKYWLEEARLQQEQEQIQRRSAKPEAQREDLGVEKRVDRIEDGQNGRRPGRNRAGVVEHPRRAERVPQVRHGWSVPAVDRAHRVPAVSSVQGARRPGRSLVRERRVSNAATTWATRRLVSSASGARPRPQQG